MADHTSTASGGVSKVSRRDLFVSATAAVGVALALPAGTATPDTPVMQAYREYRDYYTWLNGPAARRMTDEEFDSACDHLRACFRRVISEPAREPTDLVAKLFTAVEDAALFDAETYKAPIYAEVDALIGWLPQRSSRVPPVTA